MSFVFFQIYEDRHYGYQTNTLTENEAVQLANDQDNHDVCLFKIKLENSDLDKQIYFKIPLHILASYEIKELKYKLVVKNPSIYKNYEDTKLYYRFT